MFREIRIPNNVDDLVNYLPGYVDNRPARVAIRREVDNLRIDRDLMEADSEIEIPVNEIVQEARLAELARPIVDQAEPRFGIRQFFQTLLEEISEISPLNLILILFIALYVWFILLASRCSNITINISM